MAISARISLCESRGQKLKIIAIGGTTGSGKSALAIRIAKRFGGEIVSCDSMQIYKYMDIGTAKPTAEELAEVPHHLVGFADPREKFSLADFCALASECIRDIEARGKRVILCGGTGLYMDAVAGRLGFDDNGADEEYRSALKRIAEEKGNDALHSMLREADPEAAEKIHPNNVRRVIRTLEILKNGGTKAEHDAKAVGDPRDVLYIGLTYRSRDALYAAVDARVDRMMTDGLEREARDLISSGILTADSTAGQAIGYKEFFSCADTASVAEEIKRSTRRYAKRQLTWFRRNPDMRWFYTDDYGDICALTDAVSELISTAPGNEDLL